MKLTKQTVYLPVNGDYITAVCTYENEWVHQETVQSQEGYFFTPEQLNELLSDVIKDALNTAAENATYKHNGKMYQSAEALYYHREGIKVSKQSITNTFEETFKKYQV